MSYGIKFCPNCGHTTRITKKQPDYDGETGKLNGYYLDIMCGRPHRWLHILKGCGSFIYWGYEDQ